MADVGESLFPPELRQAARAALEAHARRQAEIIARAVAEIERLEAEVARLRAELAGRADA